MTVNKFQHCKGTNSQCNYKLQHNTDARSQQGMGPCWEACALQRLSVLRLVGHMRMSKAWKYGNSRLVHMLCGDHANVLSHQCFSMR